MNTELTTINDMSFEDLARLTGATVRENIILPVLSVNREPEDDAGNALPMGNFTVSQGDTRLYAPTALIRPFINAYQYSEYSPKEKKFVNRSIIIKSFAEEAIDMKGGLSCGKIPHKQLPELSPEEQLRQKNIKCRRLIYGTVKLYNKDKLVAETTPVLWKLAGTGFMAPDVALKTITRAKHQFFQHELTLTTKRHKQGSTIYYEIEVEANMKENLPLSDSDFETLKMFQEAISRENNYIAKCWREVKAQDIKNLDTSYSDSLKELELNDPVDDL